MSTRGVFMINHAKSEIVWGKTLGELLSLRRAQFGWTTKHVSQMTMIPERFILALEKNDLKQLPGDIYVRNFLKTLAGAYDVEEGLIMQKLTEETYGLQEYTPTSHKVGSHSARRARFSTDFWRRIQLSIAGTLVIGYIGFQIYSLTLPPTLEIYSPTNNFKTVETAVTVSGKTEPEAELTINNKKIFLNADGLFNETIYLTTGHHALTIEAHKKYSRTQIKTLQIMVMNGAQTDLLTLK